MTYVVRGCILVLFSNQRTVTGRHELEVGRLDGIEYGGFTIYISESITCCIELESLWLILEIQGLR